MSANHVSISIEKAPVAEVTASLEAFLGVAFSTDQTAYVVGLKLWVADLTDEMAYTQRFLKEHGIEAVNPVWRELDAQSFRVEVQLAAMLGLFGDLCRDAVADAVARNLSRDLGVRTVLSIDNGTVPFGIYQGGKSIRDFKAEYTGQFANRGWIPRSLLP